MSILTILALAICLIGGLLYLTCTESAPRLAELGRWMFIIGLGAFLWSLGGKTI